MQGFIVHGMTAINALVGGNVRAARQERGLTQRGLAELVTEQGWKVDSTAIARIESGTRALRVEQIETLAAALDVSVSVLMHDVEADEPTSLVHDMDAFVAAVEKLLAMKQQTHEAQREVDEARERLERRGAMIGDAYHTILPKVRHV